MQYHVLDNVITSSKCILADNMIDNGECCLAIILSHVMKNQTKISCLICKNIYIVMLYIFLIGSLRDTFCLVHSLAASSYIMLLQRNP